MFVTKDFYNNADYIKRLKIFAKVEIFYYQSTVMKKNA